MSVGVEIRYERREPKRRNRRQDAEHSVLSGFQPMLMFRFVPVGLASMWGFWPRQGNVEATD